jgi:hypothetical protein
MDILLKSTDKLFPAVQGNISQVFWNKALLEVTRTKSLIV